MKTKTKILPLNVSSTSKRMKVGYISASFHESSIPHFVLPILRAHNRRNIEVYCYAQCYKGLSAYDNVTDSIRKASDHFIDVTALTKDQLKKKIFDDGIHILVVLGNDIRQSTQIRAAPIQVSYLSTCELPLPNHLDFYIAEDHITPSKDKTMLDITGGSLCFDIQHEFPPNKTLIEEKTSITFGSLASHSKITLHTIEIWSEILHQVKNSIMILKRPSNIRTTNEILQTFSSHKIDAERIQFLSHKKTYGEYVRQYNTIDIILDTFPCTGRATTCEALWMGTPVVTLVEHQHPQQQISHLILKKIGYTETIAYTTEDYVNTAVSLAKSADSLAELGKNISNRFIQSPLCNPGEFCFNLENAYIKAWNIKTGKQWRGREITYKELPNINYSRKSAFLPGATKKQRTLMICDQLNPLTWHAIRTHCERSAVQNRDEWLIILTMPSQNRDLIIRNICDHIHFNYLELFDPVRVHIISCSSLQEIRSIIPYAKNFYWVNSNHDVPKLKKWLNQYDYKILYISNETLVSSRNTLSSHNKPISNSKVTICIPTYNRCQLLQRTIQSILNQQHNNFLLLISDNASSDHTEAYCKELAKNDSRVLYHRNRENIGPMNNFIQLYHMVKTELFIFCSDDDFLEPNHLLRTVTIMRKKRELGMAYGQCNIVNMQDEITNTINFTHTTDCIVDPKQELLESFLRNQIIWTSALFRKDVVESMLEWAREHFHLNLERIFNQAGGDYLFIVLMLAYAPAAFVSVPVANLRINPDSFSAKNFLDSGLEIDITVIEYLYQIYIQLFGIDPSLKRALKVGCYRRLQRLQKLEQNTIATDENKRCNSHIQKEVQTLHRRIQNMLSKTIETKKSCTSSAFIEVQKLYDIKQLG